jgi:hypothetical protein
MIVSNYGSRTSPRFLEFCNDYSQFGGRGRPTEKDLKRLQSFWKIEQTFSRLDKTVGGRKRDKIQDVKLPLCFEDTKRERKHKR